MMAAWALPALILCGGYILGSIPFGLLLTRAAGGGDLRAIGSGNIGATNVLRTGRKGLAALTLLLDGGKGATAVLIAGAIAPGPVSGMAPVAAIGAFYGHLLPIWLRFRGGKGIATYLGVALALSWPCGLVFAAVWLAGALLTRHSSVGGMAAAMLTPAAAALLDRPMLVPLFLLFGLSVLWTHRQNIARLVGGTEPRIGER